MVAERKIKNQIMGALRGIFESQKTADHNADLRSRSKWNFELWRIELDSFKKKKKKWCTLNGVHLLKVTWRGNFNLSGRATCHAFNRMSLKTFFFIWLCQVLVAAHGIFCCSTHSLAAAPRLSCLAACGISVLWPGMESMIPALQGRFLTTDHQGRPHMP